MLKSKSISLCLALAFGLAACGSDPSPTPEVPTTISGLSAGTTLSGLNDQEAAKFCSAIQDYMTAHAADPFSDIVCTVQALYLGTPETCEELRTQCLESDFAQADVPDSDNPCTSETLSGCSATVAQVEACWTDTAREFQVIAESLTCSTDLEAWEEEVYARTVPSCTALPADCLLVENENEGCVENWIGDGMCDDVNNNAECSFDGGDCDDVSWEDTGCIEEWISDSVCDSLNNNAECGWDGGDCCPSTCVDSIYLCGDNGFACEDPNACENSSNGCF